MKPLALMLCGAGLALSLSQGVAQEAGTPPSPSASAAAPAPAKQALEKVQVQGGRSSVEKSYRRITEGMDFFEQHRQRLPADRQLYFRFVPLVPGLSMEGAKLRVWTNDWTEVLPIEAASIFQLPRHKAWERDWAMVSPNRPAGSVTWRTLVRGDQFDPSRRRLGDLRMECEVGFRAELISNPHWMLRLLSTFTSIGNCGMEGESSAMRSGYILFAEKPLFGVTLRHGDRTMRVSTTALHGRGDDHETLDSRMLRDRIYFLPLRDDCWPDDTEVLLEYVDDAAAGPQEWRMSGSVRQLQAQDWRVEESQSPRTREEALARWGETQVLRFGSGHEMWIYGQQRVNEAAALKAEKDRAEKDRVAREKAAKSGVTLPATQDAAPGPTASTTDWAALAAMPGMARFQATERQKAHGHRARQGEWVLLFSPSGERIKQYRIAADVELKPGS